jgi:hypothetical protein
VEEAAPRLDPEALGRAALTMIASSVVSDLRMREAATGIKPGLDAVEIVTLSGSGGTASVGDRSTSKFCMKQAIVSAECCRSLLARMRSSAVIFEPIS